MPRTSSDDSHLEQGSDHSGDDALVFETPDAAQSPKKRSKRRAKLSPTSSEGSGKKQRISVVRKERNRLHARNSRHRRKQELDTLRLEASVLRDENLRLHQLLASTAPSLAEQLCNDIASTVPSAATFWRLRTPMPQICDSDYNLLRDMIQCNRPFLFLDTPLPGKYILYVSPTLETSLGYRRQDILGQEWSSVFGDAVHQFYRSDGELDLNIPKSLELIHPTSQSTHPMLCTLHALHTHTAVLCYVCVFGSK